MRRSRRSAEKCDAWLTRGPAWRVRHNSVASFVTATAFTEKARERGSQRATKTLAARRARAQSRMSLRTLYPFASTPSVSQFIVVVPPGVSSGQTLHVRSPDGQTLATVVPPGTGPGASFLVSYAPARAPPAPLAATAAQPVVVVGTPVGVVAPDAERALSAPDPRVVRTDRGVAICASPPLLVSGQKPPTRIQCAVAAVRRRRRSAVRSTRRSPTTSSRSLPARARANGSCLTTPRSPVRPRAHDRARRRTERAGSGARPR